MAKPFEISIQSSRFIALAYQRESISVKTYAELSVLHGNRSKGTRARVRTAKASRSEKILLTISRRSALECDTFWDASLSQDYACFTGSVLRCVRIDHGGGSSDAPRERENHISLCDGADQTFRCQVIYHRQPLAVVLPEPLERFSK